MTRRFCAAAVMLFILSTVLTSCKKSDERRFQGYVEGEFVYVASPLGGQLEELKVDRGSQVKKGDLLFVLDSIAEKAARDEAARRVLQSKATLEDARKGKRPSEIESLQAQLKQAEASLEYSEAEATRQEGLAKTGATSAQDLDRSKAARDQDRARVNQLRADLKTAQLGQREDLVAAAEADVRANEAALAKAEWDLSQKRQYAMQDAPVFDVFYRPGEWVAAGKPVVALLPPLNVKVRAFVGEADVAGVQVGQNATVTMDGIAGSFTGKVNFISPRAEFTPPVIYSRESRGKLVFLIEIVFDAETAAKLHPGQPVDVQFGK